MATKALESWDDDLELQGPILTQSSTTRPGSISSRLSFRSESNAGQDDWSVPIAPNDQQSMNNAISSAKQAGIPIPANIPSSALLGGTIKRLGNKKPVQTTAKDDWGDDLELPDKDVSNALRIKTTTRHEAPAAFDDDPDDMDWADGSLGVRFGGTRRASKNRSSSISAMSPSATSGVTLESEEDGLGGLVLPTGPLDFEDALRKRIDATSSKTTHAVTNSTDSAIKTPIETMNSNRISNPAPPKDDFMADIDFGTGDVFDPRKGSFNRNVRQNWKPTQSPSPALRTQTSLTFTDRAAGTKIPRPVPNVTPKPPKLEPVYETGATNITRSRRLEPTTNSSHILRSKRSAPVLRPHQPTSKPQPPPGPFQPSTAVTPSGRAATLKSPQHARRDSDPNRPQSPNLRTHSRLANPISPDTPTRQRRDFAPAALAREAAAKRTITRPVRRRNYGDGSELDTFDDLPTSAARESLYMKQPSSKPPPKYLRTQTSQSRLGNRERMTTPSPAVAPRSPTKAEHLPHFARDTAASRRAREQTLGSTNRSRADGPLMPRTNWPAQVAARNPHLSPTANRQRKGPQLVSHMGKENIRHFQEDAAKKGMHWNAALCRWEGNENAVLGFDPPAPPSPPRPALITNIKGPQGVQVVGGMVFDPQQMCWLKLGATPSDPMSPSAGDNDDPFRDIEDLHDTPPATATMGPSTGQAGGTITGDWLVGEEFDLGPEFIRRQREEEEIWRHRVKGWFGAEREREGESYKWAIRDIAATALI